MFFLVAVLHFIPKTDCSERPVALVTGGARRIGAEIVKALHSSGYRVVIHYHRSESEATALCNELNQSTAQSAEVVAGDLQEFNTYQSIAEQLSGAFGRLDLLVNNASTFYPTPFGQITEADWNDLLGSNLKAPTFLSQALIPLLKESNGNIVNIVDVHARQPMSAHPVYSSAKAGLQMLTLSMAKELGPDVRVNGVAPGAILWADSESDPQYQADTLSKTALKRLGDPQNIANAVVYLAQADYVTGHILNVDGGRSIGW